MTQSPNPIGVSRPAVQIKTTEDIVPFLKAARELGPDHDDAIASSVLESLSSGLTAHTNRAVREEPVDVWIEGDSAIVGIRLLRIALLAVALGATLLIWYTMSHAARFHLGQNDESASVVFLTLVGAATTALYLSLYWSDVENIAHRVGSFFRSMIGG